MNLQVCLHSISASSTVIRELSPIEVDKMDDIGVIGSDVGGGGGGTVVEVMVVVGMGIRIS